MAQQPRLPLRDRLARIAILGGDARPHRLIQDRPDVIHFPAKMYGGRRWRKMLASLKRGSFGRVIILTRFIDHSTSTLVRSVCSALDIACVLVCNNHQLQLALQ